MTTQIQPSQVEFPALVTIIDINHGRPVNIFCASSSPALSLGLRSRDGHNFTRQERRIAYGWNSPKTMHFVKFNRGFVPNSGGGGREPFLTTRLLGNIALAVGLTYLSMTGQLRTLFEAIGWIFDALISLWLFVVIVPIIGIGFFFWWAQRDIVQSSCPNCGNEFQMFRSSLNDELQLCPFCSQPFSVVDDKFVIDSAKFSNQSSPIGKERSVFSSASMKESSSAIVDIEADVKDAE